MVNLITKEQVDHVMNLIHHKSAELSKLQTGLKALQGICEHNMKYEGHGHNSKFYKCSFCRYEEER